MGVPVALHPCQFLILPFFFIAVIFTVTLISAWWLMLSIFTSAYWLQVASLMTKYLLMEIKQHYSFRFLQFILTNIQNRQNSFSVSAILHRPFPKMITYFLDSFKFLTIFWRRQQRHVVYTNQLWAFLLKIRPMFYFQLFYLLPLSQGLPLAIVPVLT